MIYEKDHDYSDDDDEARSLAHFNRRIKEETVLPPDDIEPDITVAGADTSSMLKTAVFAWQIFVLQRVCGEVGPSLRPPEEQHPIPGVSVAPGILLHLAVLACCFTFTAKRVIAHCGLFLTPKSCGKKSRLIFDCRPGNIMIMKEAKSRLKLFTFDSLFDLLATLLLHPDIVIVDGDLRQFYYQIAFPVALAYFFGACIHNQWYIPKALPMGFHNASLWGQTITLSALLFREKGEDALGVDVDQLQGPTMPRYILLFDECRGPKPSSSSRTMIGVIVALMDGFIVVVRGVALGRLWRRRIWRNMRLFRLKLKALSPLPANAKEVKPDDPSHFLRLTQWGNDLSGPSVERFVTFGGLDIRAGPQAGWRPNKEGPEAPSIDDDFSGTAQQICSLLGRLHWQLRVHDTHPLDHLDLLALWSRVTPSDARDASAWKQTISLSRDERCAIDSAVRTLPPRDTWYLRPPPPTPSLCLLVISDAYTEGTGFLILDGTFRLLGSVHFDTHGDQSAQEMLAIIDAIDLCIALARARGHSAVGIIFGTDADSVRSALGKGSSTQPGFIPLLQRLRTLRGFPVRLAGVRIAGINNVADVISRRSSLARDKAFLCPDHLGPLNCPQCIHAALSHSSLSESIKALKEEVTRTPWWLPHPYVEDRPPLDTLPERSAPKRPRLDTRLYSSAPLHAEMFPWVQALH